MKTRQAGNRDAQALCGILNQIIGIGGTTAFEKALSESEIESYFISGETCLCCFVAEKDGALLGFQSLSYHEKLPEGWADIATFARAEPKTPGVGTALFASTLAFARQNEIRWLNATIRADNKPGLAYYGKMGFEDYAVARQVPLQDGTPIDRISKKYRVASSDS